MNNTKNKRIEEIFDKGSKTVIIPLDDALISGPEHGLRNIQNKLEEIIEGKPNAIFCFKGLVKNHKDIFNENNVPYIINLTASTTKSNHTKKVLVSDVEEALKLEASAVGVHVNICSQYAHEQIKILGEISKQCDINGMPLFALMYPRGEIFGRDNNYQYLRNSPLKFLRDKYAKLVRHAVRVGVDLGADIIKTYYTGDNNSFKTVIDVCGNIPVVIAGGPKKKQEEILYDVDGAMKAGASGVCIGRSTFNRTDTTNFVKELKKHVYNNEAK